MAKLDIWDENKAKMLLAKRLSNSKDMTNTRFYNTWQENENTVYSQNGNPDSYNSFGSNSPGLAEENNPDSQIAVNYSFKNLRFIHSQLSANPPIVTARPTSTDAEDKRKADAADRLIRYFPKQYGLQEKFDMATLNCLVFGTAFIKTLWNPEAGDIVDHNPDGTVILDGDISVTVPSLYDIFLDPDAETWEDVTYIYERRLVPYVEACYTWPDKVELLKKNRQTSDPSALYSNPDRLPKYDVVEIFEYWEKGKPYNAMLGRYCICMSNGELVTPVMPNPCSFRSGKNPPTAHLPYHIMTDIDVPRQIYGKSFLEYEGRLQDVFNRVDRLTLDNIKAHGAARLIVPEGCDVDMDNSITDSPYDIIKIKGISPPHFIAPMQMSPNIPQFREQIRQGIDDMAGVNDAMMGNVKRETSGFSLQYATNNGNMIRRRLFNKYTLMVESVYKFLLNLVQKHWDDTKIIYVLGKEKAFEAVELKGADIDGGFDLVPEYGVSLSLDPMVRREEIMTMLPLFEKAGVPTKTILGMIKLNELEGLYDEVQLADDRQREIFEEMIATGRYIPPRKMQDHINMIAYGHHYVMTTEFKYLDEEQKLLIEQHIEERAILAAKEQQPPAPPLPPGPLPAGPESVPQNQPIAPPMMG